MLSIKMSEKLIFEKMKKKHSYLLIILCMSTVSIKSISQQSTVLQNYYKQVRKSFNEGNAFETVAFVEKRWRLAGNKGFNESIYYVEDILKKSGFVNELVAHSSDRLTYRIEKRAMKSPTWEPVDASVEIVGEIEPLLLFKTNRNMLAINSGSTPPEGIEVEVLYSEKNTKDEIDKLTLNGKVLFLEQRISQVYQTAISKGAIGAIGYSIPSYTQPQKHVNSIQFSSIQNADSLSKTFGILLSTKAKDRLKASLSKGPVHLRIKINTKKYQSEELTIIADVRGNKNPDERFVFSAHVQEPGANDNATGVGTLAEMARVIAELFKSGQFAPGRSITFLWGDEIVSTKRYVTENKELAKGIKWGMSLDMVGEDTQKTGGTFLIEKMPDPSAVWTRGEEKHTEWGGSPISESAIVPHYFNDFILNRCLDQAKTNGWIVKTNPFEGGSDHTPFLEAKMPGLLLWHFTDVFYHTDGDRIENVSAWEMKNVGIAALVSAMALTTVNEETSIFLVEELKQTAFKRFEIEKTLSKDIIQKGGNKETQKHIIEVWGKYYEEALGKMENLQVGGSTEKVLRVIKMAQVSVNEKTKYLINDL